VRAAVPQHLRAGARAGHPLALHALGAQRLLVPAGAGDRGARAGRPPTCMPAGLRPCSLPVPGPARASCGHAYSAPALDRRARAGAYLLRAAAPAHPARPVLAHATPVQVLRPSPWRRSCRLRPLGGVLPRCWSLRLRLAVLRLHCWLSEMDWAYICRGVWASMAGRTHTGCWVRPTSVAIGLGLTREGPAGTCRWRTGRAWCPSCTASLTLTRRPRRTSAMTA